jgi:nitroreductase
MLMTPWQCRYGSDAPTFDSRLEAFLEHRTIRRFSPASVSEEDIAGLVAAAQSAATSSNLQSWSIVSIQDPERRLQIANLCGGQKQIITAPWFFAFIADLHRIDQYAQAAGIQADGLDTVEMFTVAAIDAALAAERMVCAAEAIGLGICYIGALRNEPGEVQKLLSLPTRTVGLFGLCIGHPSPEAKAAIKPRLAQDQVWFRETYSQSLSSNEYDARAAEFFTNQGMPSDASWAAKSGERVNISGLSGRERLLEFLHFQGLAKQ